MLPDDIDTRPVFRKLRPRPDAEVEQLRIKELPKD